MATWEIVLLVVLGIFNLIGITLYHTGEEGKKRWVRQKNIFVIFSVAFLFAGITYALFEGPRRIAKFFQNRKTAE